MVNAKGEKISDFEEAPKSDDVLEFFLNIKNNPRYIYTKSYLFQFPSFRTPANSMQEFKDFIYGKMIEDKEKEYTHHKVYQELDSLSWL